MSKQVLPGLLKHEMENVNAMPGSPNEIKARQWNVGLVCSGLEISVSPIMQDFLEYENIALCYTCSLNSQENICVANLKRPFFGYFRTNICVPLRANLKTFACLQLL